MSHLKLFAPQDAHEEPGHREDYEEEPRILSFDEAGGRFRDRWSLSVVTRARVIHRNSRCRYCNRPLVKPVELGDTLLNRNQLPIPGTATLVGFQCEACQAEWPA